MPDRYFNAVVQWVLTQAYELDEDWTAQQVKLSSFDKSLQDLTNSDQPQAGTFHVTADHRDEYDEYHGSITTGYIPAAPSLDDIGFLPLYPSLNLYPSPSLFPGG